MKVACFLLFLLMLFLIGLEIVLRAVTFRYEPDAEFSYPRPADFAEVRYDPELFWTLNPEDAGVNARGFLGKEMTVEKPAGTYRMLFIGDSIMEAGYPEEVEVCLQAAGFANIEAVSLAVRGYSSYQGQVMAEKYGRLLQPDLVLVQFGWNDHWLAFGEPDVEKSFAPPSEWALKIHGVYDRVRVFQAAGWVWGVLLGQGNAITGAMRVSPEAYADNLRAMKTLFEGDNVPVWILTAPSAHAQFGVSEDLIQRQFAKDAESVLSLHAAYNEIAREVAGEKLVEVAGAFEAFTAAEMRTFFQLDGIHPTRLGTEKIASVVCEAVHPYLP
jgi:lysophospholipase L1-like esterase